MVLSCLRNANNAVIINNMSKRAISMRKNVEEREDENGD